MDVLKELRKIRYSSPRERNARRALSINAIAERAGFTRIYVHYLASGKRPLTENARAKLEQALKPVNDNMG